MGMRPVSVGTRRDGSQLHVTVSLERPLMPADGGVDLDPPIEVSGGDTVHFEVTAERCDYHPTGTRAFSYRATQRFVMRQDSVITRLFDFGYVVDGTLAERVSRAVPHGTRVLHVPTRTCVSLPCSSSHVNSPPAPTGRCILQPVQ